MVYTIFTEHLFLRTLCSVNGPGSSWSTFSKGMETEMIRQVPISNLSAFFSEEGLTVDYCS